MKKSTKAALGIAGILVVTATSLVAIKTLMLKEKNHSQNDDKNSFVRNNYLKTVNLMLQNPFLNDANLMKDFEEYREYVELYANSENPWIDVYMQKIATFQNKMLEDVINKFLPIVANNQITEKEKQFLSEFIKNQIDRITENDLKDGLTNSNLTNFDLFLSQINNPDFTNENVKYLQNFKEGVKAASDKQTELINHAFSGNGRLNYNIDFLDSLPTDGLIKKYSAYPNEAIKLVTSGKFRANDLNTLSDLTDKELKKLVQKDSNSGLSILDNLNKDSATIQASLDSILNNAYTIEINKALLSLEELLSNNNLTNENKTELNETLTQYKNQDLSAPEAFQAISKISPKVQETLLSHVDSNLLAEANKYFENTNKDLNNASSLEDLQEIKSNSNIFKTNLTSQLKNPETLKNDLNSYIELTRQKFAELGNQTTISQILSEHKYQDFIKVDYQDTLNSEVKNNKKNLIDAKNDLMNEINQQLTIAQKYKNLANEVANNKFIGPFEKETLLNALTYSYPTSEEQANQVIDALNKHLSIKNQYQDLVSTIDNFEETTNSGNFLSPEDLANITNKTQFVKEETIGSSQALVTKVAPKLDVINGNFTKPYQN
ncbi:hypothetical protein [Mycoplasmopsis gallopavonis]|uniref:Uncharacterized protein n=1 Tax=Mycoplasmopsis gallopavonis TaxID=76629 RepID=A0A449AZ49_9BACT|nr:hypothetical protein [Mycoplasmopsis gallopavonis]RIV16920.1 hypothetical protein D1113_00360 [Mycoplasmopsis gallopavonis]VEU72745.1 Uncharacterised protein [Mycoplasmopsis gallopavonis]